MCLESLSNRDRDISVSTDKLDWQINKEVVQLNWKTHARVEVDLFVNQKTMSCTQQFRQDSDVMHM